MKNTRSARKPAQAGTEGHPCYRGNEIVKMLWETDVVLIVRVTALKFNKLCSFPYNFHSDTEVSALILLLGFRVTSFLPLPALLKLASVALERPWRGL